MHTPADANFHDAMAQLLVQRLQGHISVITQIIDRDGANHPQHIGNLLAGLRTPVSVGALQLGMDLSDNLGLKKLTQLHRAQ